MTGHSGDPCRTVKPTATILLAAGALLIASAVSATPHRLEKRFPVDPHATLVVRNKSGKVSIKSWSKPEVLIVATHVSEKTEVDAEKVGNRIDVMTHVLSENVAPAELQADIEITVPEQTELQIRNDSGDVIVERVAGDMTFDTVGATVELQEVAGFLVVKTVGGSFTCVRCAGRLEVKSISGSFRILQPQLSSLRAETMSGNILYEGAFQRFGTYRMNNYSGVTEVRFLEADSFEVSASSQFGKVENDAVFKPRPHQPQAAARVGNSLFGTYNSGQARVELTSFNGTIKVRKQ